MYITDFYTKGYTSVIDDRLELLIENIHPITDWKVDSTGIRYPAHVNLENAHRYIAENYVYPIFGQSELGYKSIWEGTDTPSLKWHNDLVEGSNLFFMYYLTTVNNSGELCFRVNGIETGKIQPKKHLLVMGSQEAHVEHKVNPTTELRIACNFGFSI